jgi:hypothetical protein
MIDFKTFDNAIKSIKEYFDTNDKLTKLLKVEGIISANVMSNIIEFIEVAFNDKSKWIDYYIYDLDFGKKYKPGCVSIKESEKTIDIKLKTAKDLYNLLIDNYNKSNEV